LQRFFIAFNAGFNASRAKYTRSLGFLIKNKWIPIGVLAASVVLIVWSDSTIPKGFVPTEDRGVVFVNIELPPGASLDRTYKVTEDLYAQMESIEGIRTATLVSGRNFFSGAGSSYALGFIILEDWDNRTTEATSIDAIVAKLNEKSAT
jgi:hydrophobic/amphiphilic exporter-1 (mainly G- bacteria), HAE1 family